MGAGQRRTTEIARGLFAVRYVGADDSAQPPIVKVTAEPNSEAHVDVILHPDHEEPVLLASGNMPHCAGDAPGMLAIEVEPSRPNGSIAATVNIEPLIQGEAIASATGRRNSLAARRVGGPPADIRVLGHIAGNRRRLCGRERMACRPDRAVTHRRNFDRMADKAGRRRHSLFGQDCAAAQHIRPHRRSRRLSPERAAGLWR